MRTPAPPAAPPADIRLMNATATVLGAIGVAALAGMLLMWALRHPAFAVRSIRIDGDLAHNSVLTIRANAAPRLAGNFFTLDLSTARRAFESVPWVRHAVVRRVWPNRLAVQLEEHRPVALWAELPGSDARGSSTNRGRTRSADLDADKLVNSHGEVFEANLGDVEDDALPTLRGPQASAPHMLALLGRLQPVFDTLEAHIEVLELSGRGSWRVELDSGAQVELGRGSDDEVIERTTVFAATLTQVTQRYQRALQYADLRHSEGYAVRLKGVSTSVDVAPAKPARR
jgi:cell division protein FtsQ